MSNRSLVHINIKSQYEVHLFFLLNLTVYKKSLSKQTSEVEAPLQKTRFFPNAYWVKKDEKRSHKKMAAPCKRWGHGVVLYENQIYLFGGSGNNTNSRNWEAIYILNCDTFEWERICPTDPFKGNIPEPRDSHSATRIGNNMYIFGGSNGNAPFNDIFAFNFTFRSWNKVVASGDIPLPREGHSAVPLNDRYVFIYGGWNGKMVYNNYYLFDSMTNIWRKVEPEDASQEPPIRESHSCCVIKDNFYIFGGQGVNIKKRENYLNDFYKGKLNFHKNMEKITCKWEKIIAKNNASPPHRTSHSACVYKDRFIFIIGGEGYCMDNKDLKQWEHEKKDIFLEKDIDDEKAPPCFPKNDVWIYDTENNSWSLLEAKNSELLMPRFTHSCSVYKDQFIIYGGLKDYKNSIDELVVLIIDDEDFRAEKNKKDIDLCNSCRRIFMVENESTHIKHSLFFSNEDIMLEGSSKTDTYLDEAKMNQYEKLKSLSVGKHSKQAEISSQNFQIITPSISLQMISKFASMIAWPFAAFGLLIDNAIIKKSTTLKISWGNTKSQNKAFLNFTDDGEVWTMKEICDICLKMKLDLNNYVDYDQKEQEERDKAQHEISKSMYSINLKLGGFRLGDTIIYGSKTETSIIICYMTLKENPDLESNIVIAMWGLKSEAPNEKRKKIIENLSQYFTEQELIDIIGKNSLIIMDLKQILGKGELSFPKNQEKNDIFFKPHKFIGIKLDFPYKEYIDFSLKKYLEYFFMSPENLPIKIFLKEEEIAHINAIEKIEKDPSFRHLELPQDIILCFDKGKLFIKHQNESTSPKNGESKKDITLLETENQTSNLEKEKTEEIKNIDKENTNIQSPQRINQGILFYYNERIICRFGGECFGDLLFLQHKFKKSQMDLNKNSKEIFSFSGALHLKDFLKTNIVKTVIINFSNKNYINNFKEIENQQRKNVFHDLIKKYLKQEIKRANNAEVFHDNKISIEPEPMNQTKQINEIMYPINLREPMNPSITEMNQKEDTLTDNIPIPIPEEKIIVETLIEEENHNNNLNLENSNTSLKRKAEEIPEKDQEEEEIDKLRKIQKIE